MFQNQQQQQQPPIFQQQFGAPITPVQNAQPPQQQQFPTQSAFPQGNQPFQQVPSNWQQPPPQQFAGNNQSQQHPLFGQNAAANAFQDNQQFPNGSQQQQLQNQMFNQMQQQFLAQMLQQDAGQQKIGESNQKPTQNMPNAQVQTFNQPPFQQQNMQNPQINQQMTPQMAQQMSQMMYQQFMMNNGGQQFQQDQTQNNQQTLNNLANDQSFGSVHSNSVNQQQQQQLQVQQPQIQQNPQMNNISVNNDLTSIQQSSFFQNQTLNNQQNVNQVQPNLNIERNASYSVEMQISTGNPEEAKVPKKTKKAKLSKDEMLISQIDPNILYASDPKMRYSIIFETKNMKDEDIMCDVCLDDHVDDGEDELIICDLCNAAVHQSCYGNEIMDRFPPREQNWYCQRCIFLLQNPEAHGASVKCFFCNDLKGIIIRDLQVGWAHITCVNWTPEIWWKDDYKLCIDGQINQDRFKLYCYICRQKGTGSAMQCDYKNCQQAYHVRCAISKGLIRDWESMNDQRENEDAYECYIFCDKHLEIGKRDLKQGGRDRIKQASEKAQIEEKIKKFSHQNFQRKKKAKSGKVRKDLNYDQEQFERENQEHQEDEEDEDEDATIDDHSDGESQYLQKNFKPHGRSTHRPHKHNKKSGFGLRVTNKVNEMPANNQNWMNDPNTAAFMMMMQQMIAMQQQQMQPMEQPPSSKKPNQQQRNSQFQQPAQKQLYPNLQQQQMQNSPAYLPPQPQSPPTFQQQPIYQQPSQQYSHQQTPDQQMSNNFPPMQSQQHVPDQQFQQQPLQQQWNNQQQPQQMQNSQQQQQQQQQSPQRNAASSRKAFKGKKPTRATASTTVTQPQNQAPSQQHLNIENNYGTPVMQQMPQQQNTARRSGSRRSSNFGAVPQQNAQQMLNQEIDKKFQVEPYFAGLIKLPGTIQTRKEIQNAFIAYAIENQLVDITTRVYEIQKNPFLLSHLKVKQIQPNEIFKYLKDAFLQPID